jgi:hypothetical protein
MANYSNNGGDWGTSDAWGPTGGNATVGDTHDNVDSNFQDNFE